MHGWKTTSAHATFNCAPTLFKVWQGDRTRSRAGDGAGDGTGDRAGGRTGDRAGDRTGDRTGGRAGGRTEYFCNHSKNSWYVRTASPSRWGEYINYSVVNISNTHVVYPGSLQCLYSHSPLTLTPLHGLSHIFLLTNRHSFPCIFVGYSSIELEAFNCERQINTGGISKRFAIV